MKNIILVERLFDEENGWETVEHKIMVDGEQVGTAYTISHEDEDEVYLEDITIDEAHRNKGIGTQVIRMLATKYSYIYFAPTGEDNKRLYERIAEEEPSFKDHDAIDQGYGVYYLEG